MLTLKLVATLAFACACMAQSAVKQNGQVLQPSQYRFMKMVFNRRLNLFDVPTMVRMAFHDCVGGCDGCLDHTNPSNRGLQDIWEFAKQFRNDVAPQLSMADVVAFLGIEALSAGAQQSNNTVNVDFWVGRKDCDKNPVPKRTFIQHNEMDGVQKLAELFDLNEKEVVALMGCHSLGGMREENSGFTLPVTFAGRAPWDRTPLGLDHQYYGEMLSGTWIPKWIKNHNINSTFWTKGPTEQLMMLNADMGLFKNFTVSGDLDEPSCKAINFTSCATPSSTFQHVLDFARSEDDFLKTLEVAFGKMINGNKRGLTLVNSIRDFAK